MQEEIIVEDNSVTTNKPNKLKYFFKNVLSTFMIPIAKAALLVYFLTSYVFVIVQVDGYSMYPTLDDNSRLFVEKISYRFGEPERYDIIPFLYKTDIYYIKRIIGLPGETVRIDNEGNIYINGEIIEDVAVAEDCIFAPGVAKDSITLGDDEYFVLGDNRNGSMDSRSSDVGLVHRDDIVGKVSFCISPEIKEVN